MSDMDLTQFDGHTPGPWRWEHKMGYDECVDSADGLAVLDDGSAGGEYSQVIVSDSPDGALVAAAPDLLAALRAAYAEIDRLRAQVPVWVTVTEDPATLPDEDDERDVLVDTVRWDSGEPSEMRTHYVLHLECDSIQNLTPGDRWAYVPKPDEVPA